MSPKKNTILKWLGIIFIFFPTLYILIVGTYSYAILSKGIFYYPFYKYPHYKFIPDSEVDAVFIMVNTVFFGTLLLTWGFIFVKRLRNKFSAFFLLCSIIPLLLLVINSRIEPRGRMFSRSGNSEIRFLEEINGRSVISTYHNEKKSVRYNPDERPKWKLVRKDTIPEDFK